MPLEYKQNKKSYDFFLLEDVTESSYSSLKREVFKNLKEIEEIDTSNAEYFKTLSDSVEIKELQPIDFNFHVSTYGGSVYDGLGIYDLIHKLDRINKRVRVNIFCEGKIMSAGIFIVLAARNRFCTPNTTFMIHQISTILCGKLEMLKENVQECDRLNEIVETIITSNSRISKEEMNEWNKCKKMYFLALMKQQKEELFKK